MIQTLRHTLLEEAQRLFLHHGFGHFDESQLRAALGVSLATFREMFQDKPDLVTQAVRQDIERQKQEHRALYQQYANPVERLLGLLSLGIRDLQKASAAYFVELQRDHPAAWQLTLDHLAHYSYPQIHQLLNEGIVLKQLRGDINIELVTKIIMEQLNMMLNPAVFPPARYNLTEVFRSIYLYYIRGLCTPEGVAAAASHFAKL